MGGNQGCVEDASVRDEAKISNLEKVKARTVV